MHRAHRSLAVSLALLAAFSLSSPSRAQETGAGTRTTVQDTSDPGSSDDQASADVRLNPYVLLLAAPALAFLGVLAGQFLPEFFTRRRTVAELYDAAISAVAKVQANRHGGGGVNVPQELTKAPDAASHAQVLQELSTDGLRRFIESAAEARAALAALHPYSPDLRKYWDRFEIPEEDLDEITEILIKRKKRPLKRHAAE